MKRNLLYKLLPVIFCVITVAPICGQEKDYAIRPVPFTSVQLNDKFWLPKIEITGNKVQTIDRPFTAIPYFAWANRGKTEMKVWFPQQVKAIDLLTK